MVWFKVDDSFWSHPKTIELSDAAVALWTRAGSYSAHHSTDGRISAGTLRLVGGARDTAEELVRAGLWAEVDERTWEYHDWGVYQPDSASTKAKHAAESEAGSRGNHLRWHEKRGRFVPDCSYCEASAANQATDQVADEVADRAPDQAPDQVRRLAPESPVPGTDPAPVIPTGITGGGPRKRGTRIPESFMVTAEMREWAAGRTPLVDVDAATERFVNHWRAKAGKDATKLDWLATWRNWLIRDQDDRADRGRLTPTERARQTLAAGRGLHGSTLGSRAAERQASNLAVVARMAALDSLEPPKNPPVDFTPPRPSRRRTDEPSRPPALQAQPRP